jgi:hypothetical protein
MDPVSLTIAVSAIAASVGSIVPLIQKWLSLRKDLRSSSRGRITIRLEGRDGTPIAVDIDEAKLDPKKIEELLQGLRAATAETSKPDSEGQARGEKQ